MDRPITDYSSRIPRGTAAAPGNWARPAEEAAREQIKHWIDALRRWVVENPGVSLGIAVGIGVYLGWWIKRR